MTARYIEYYEVVDVYAANPVTEYFFMPKDRHAANKKNMDSASKRIWLFDIERNTFQEIRNVRKDSKPLSKADMLVIQLTATPVPMCEHYLRLEEAKAKRAKKND